MQEANQDGNSVGFVVMVKNGATWDGLGFRLFRIVPRVGEYITMNDEAGKGQAYQVKAIFHPLEILPDCAGDLILEHAGTDVAVRGGL
jgi:hypothetical protein